MMTVTMVTYKDAVTVRPKAGHGIQPDLSEPVIHSDPLTHLDRFPCSLYFFFCFRLKCTSSKSGNRKITNRHILSSLQYFKTKTI